MEEDDDDESDPGKCKGKSKGKAIMHIIIRELGLISCLM